MKKIVIVGGVAGGASAAARCRRLDENAQIIIFEKDRDISFSNCGLPYHISGHIKNRDSLLMMTPELFKSQYNIDAKPYHEVIGFNPKTKKVKIRMSQTKQEYEESYDELIIATGGRAKNISKSSDSKVMPSFYLKNVEDLDCIMKLLNKKPKHITVVGGGYIGVEVVENLKLRGINVALIECSNQILMPIDFDLVQIINKELVDQGVDLMHNVCIDKVNDDTIILSNNQTLKTNGIIYASGIIPNSEFAKASGIKVDKTGHIIVNEKFQTNIPHVWAVGDVIEVENLISKEKCSIPLAGLANKQGRYVANAIYHKHVLKNGAIGSSVVKIFDITAAATGLNERTIKEKGFNYETISLVPMTAVGIMPEAKPIHLKVHYDKKTHKILGGQAITKGIGAEKRIDIIATMIKQGGKITDLVDLELCYAPPYGTGKDAVNMCGYIAENIIDGLFKQVQYYQLFDKVKDGIIIDVREKSEWDAGHIKTAINIPMSEFRQRINEVPKDKDVFIHCRSGQRSYNICLYLQSQGYKNVYNVAGSYISISHYYDTLHKQYGGQNVLTKPNFK